MKKVLLATTVLAAVSVATPVLAQEVSVTGSYRFGWESYSDDNEIDGIDDSFTRTYTDSEIHINFSNTTDSGLTYGATFELEGDVGSGENDGQGGSDIDESSLSLSGDFGTVILGNNDYAHDSFTTGAPTHHGTLTSDSRDFVRFEKVAVVAAANQNLVPNYLALNDEDRADADNAAVKALADAIKNNADADHADFGLSDFSDTLSGTDVAAPYYAGNASYGDNTKITYMSPNFSGFQFGVSVTDTAGDPDDESSDISFGASFTGGSGMMDDMMDGGMMDGMTYTITGNSFDNGEDGDNAESSTAFGGTLGLGELTLTAATSSSEVGSGLLATETSALQFGVGYDINDALSIGASWSDGESDTNDQELEVTSLSMEYTIAPGLAATAAWNAYSAIDSSAAEADDGLRTNDGTMLVFSIAASF